MACAGCLHDVVNPRIGPHMNPIISYTAYLTGFRGRRPRTPPAVAPPPAAPPLPNSHPGNYLYQRRRLRQSQSATHCGGSAGCSPQSTPELALPGSAGDAGSQGASPPLHETPETRRAELRRLEEHFYQAIGGEATTGEAAAPDAGVQSIPPHHPSPTDAANGTVHAGRRLAAAFRRRRPGFGTGVNADNPDYVPLSDR